MPLTQVQPGMLGTPQPYNFKNRIINGAMVISQRNGTSSVTPASGSFLTDRYGYYASQASKVTAQQLSASPPVGFFNYLGITIASAVSSLGSTDYFYYQQKIEGFNTADLQWGTVNAKTVTVSFWVQSSLTGTFGGSLRNGNENRGYPFTYTISAANTWEYKTITIAGDTTGTWNTDNTTGIGLCFSLGMGSTYSNTAGAWATGNYASATGVINVMATVGATFNVTGVQLEVGVTATGFDYRPYGTELLLCERYYEKSYEIGTVPGTTGVAGNWTGVGGQNYPRAVTEFKVDKRAIPTITFYADSDGTTGNVNIWNNGTVLKVAASNVFVTSKFIGPEGDYGIVLTTRASMYYSWTASAEL
jgi:hypothetical protein